MKNWTSVSISNYVGCLVNISKGKLLGVDSENDSYQYKGKINVSVGKPIIDELENMKVINGNNKKIKYLTSIIDKQIYRNYKLWSTNYIAADLLYNNNNYTDKYTSEEKKKFVSYCSGIKSKFKEEREALRKTFLRIYANPVKNCAH